MSALESDQDDLEEALRVVRNRTAQTEFSVTQPLEETLTDGVPTIKINENGTLRINKIETNEILPVAPNQNVLIKGNMAVEGNMSVMTTSSGFQNVLDMLNQRTTIGTVKDVLTGLASDTFGIKMPFGLPLPSGGGVGGGGIGAFSIYDLVDLKAPLKIQRSDSVITLASFDNTGPVFKGILTADKIYITTLNSNTLALETNGRIQTGSSILTPALKIPGTTPLASLIIENNDGSSWVAEFRNDSNIKLNGPTQITGNLNVTSGTITATALSGNASTATALQTARTINDVAFDGSADITVTDNSKLPTTGGTITGNLTVDGATSIKQIISDRVFDGNVGGGQLFLNGQVGNVIEFNSQGSEPPLYTYRSYGTRILLSPTNSANTVDYAIGIDQNTLWQSVHNETGQYKWYGGESVAATLSGSGNLSVTGTITGGGNLSVTGTITATGQVATPSITLVNGSDGGRIDFASGGMGAPTSGTRSSGTKIVLSPTLMAGHADMALGTETDALWTSVAHSGASFKWYAGQASVATLTGLGVFTATTLSAPNITLGSESLQSMLNNKANLTNPTFSGAVVNGTMTFNGANLQTTLDGKQPRTHIAIKVMGSNGSLGYSNGSTVAQQNIATSKTATGTYQISWTGSAHPSGANYSVTATASTSTLSILATALVNSSSQFTVYTRNSATAALTDCDFFVHTVP